MITLRRLLSSGLLVSGMLFSQAVDRNKSKLPTQRQTLDQLCGQLELTTPKKKQIVVNGKPEVRLYTAYLEHATVKLYQDAPTKKECCDGPALATTESGRYGAFELRGIKAGNYWLQVQKGELIEAIPFSLTEDFNERACRASYVGRSIIVDSTPPKIETRIR